MGKYNKICKLCNQEEENLVHFIINCKALEAGRNHNLIKENIKDPEEKMIDLLFKNKEHQNVGKMIKRLWYIRRDLMKLRKEEYMDEATKNANRNNNKGKRKKQTPEERKG